MTPALIALLWLLTPVPQDVTISFPVVITNLSVQTGGLVPLTTTIGDSPCAEAWEAADTNEPFEMAADDERTQVGDMFRCWGPGPKKRYDGSQN